MCTRSLGDFRLKHKEFNVDSKATFAQSYGYRKPLRHYTGPYITHKPDIRIFQLNPVDKFLILASDGLWDEIKKEEATQVVKDLALTPEKIPHK